MIENDLFISYSSLDKPKVKSFCNILKEKGYTIVVDFNDMKPDDWTKQVKTWIAISKATIIFITSNSLRSQNVAEEVKIAVDHSGYIKDHKVIAILMNNNLLSEEYKRARSSAKTDDEVNAATEILHNLDGDNRHHVMGKDNNEILKELERQLSAYNIIPKIKDTPKKTIPPEKNKANDSTKKQQNNKANDSTKKQLINNIEMLIASTKYNEPISYKKSIINKLKDLAKTECNDSKNAYDSFKKINSALKTAKLETTYEKLIENINTFLKCFRAPAIKRVPVGNIYKELKEKLSTSSAGKEKEKKKKDIIQPKNPHETFEKQIHDIYYQATKNLGSNTSMYKEKLDILFIICSYIKENKPNSSVINLYTNICKNIYLNSENNQLYSNLTKFYRLYNITFNIKQSNNINEQLKLIYKAIKKDLSWCTIKNC